MLIDLFKIPSTDQSMYYLGQIYGYVGNILPVESPPLLVGMMFKVLNTVVLTVGAFLVLYVVVVGLLKTAQEGEFLGRQWNSLWVPLRTVMGIAALFPTATGYSAIQVIIMWIILQGIGAADTLWSKVIDYVSVTGSPYSTVTGSSLQPTAIRPYMVKLFDSLVCQASAKANYPSFSAGTDGTIQYYCEKNSTLPFCVEGDSDMLDPLRPPAGSGGFVNSYPMGPDGACGTLTYCDMKKECPQANSDSKSCLTCKAQRQALQAIVPALGTIANKFVDLDHQYAQFYEAKKPLPEIPNWMQDYCSANNIPPEQCCPPLSANACSTLFPSDRGSKNPSDYSNTTSNNAPPFKSTEAATDLYMQYVLNGYLNGSDFIDAAVGEYTAALVGAVASDLERQMNVNNPQNNTGDPQWAAAALSAKATGWILAGAFYYKIAAMNRKTQDALQLPFSVSVPDSPLPSYRINYVAVNNMVSIMLANNAGSAGFGGANTTPALSSDITYALGSSAQGLLSSWVNSLQYNTTSATNPLVSIATFGYQMMITAQLLFVVILLAVTVITALATLNVMVLGTGITLNPLGEAIKAVLGLLSPFFILLIGALYSVGALLGIYLPLIPYMVFTMGAIGWLIATVEAMVAGPIIALGILSPGGQHDILGRAEPALMQIFNLFLRPTLMIIGLMISMLLSIVVVRFVNAGFLAATMTIMSNPGLFEQILFIAVYTSFIVTVLNKAFSLIYVIPERVLTWIGGPAVQYGEAEALQATKQAMEGAAGGVTGGAKESGGGAEKAGTMIKGADRDRKGLPLIAEPKNTTKGGGAAGGGTASGGTPPQ